MSYQSYFVNMEGLKFFNHLLILFTLSSSILLLLTLLAENCRDLDKDYIALTPVIYLIVARVKTDPSAVQHTELSCHNRTYRYMTNSSLQVKHIPEALLIWPGCNAQLSELLSLLAGANPTCSLSIIFHE